MNPLPTAVPQVPTIEQGIHSLVNDAQTKVRHTTENYRERVRQSPGTAVLAALAAGYCLHRLPVRSLLVSQVRLITALAPPALLAIGAAKLCEYLQKQVLVKPRNSAAIIRPAGEFDAGG